MQLLNMQSYIHGRVSHIFLRATYVQEYSKHRVYSSNKIRGMQTVEEFEWRHFFKVKFSSYHT